MHSIEWVLFAVVTFSLLAADLFVVHRKARVLSMREASRWSAVVVSTALLFGLIVLWRSGPTSALEYYAGYLVELSLSVDNLFVFILIFQYFAVPPIAHSKVLNWGVFGAAAMRGIMIVVGTAVLGRFDWLFIILGVILLFTAAKMFKDEEEQIEPEKNPLVKLAKRLVPMTPNYEGARFFVKTPAGWLATPLFVVVLVIEWTDVVFAIDSIPAILSITQDPFIVYASNIFAILGLRAMFFVIQDAIQHFKYLKPGVGLILAFVGLKMIFIKWFHLPVAISLGVILTVLTASIVMSIIKTRRDRVA